MKKLLLPTLLVAASSSAMALTHDVQVGLTLTAACEIVETGSVLGNSSTKLDMGTHQRSGAVIAADSDVANTAMNTSHVGGSDGLIGGAANALVVRCQNLNGWEVGVNQGLPANYGMGASATHRAVKHSASADFISYELRCAALTIPAALAAALGGGGGGGVALNCAGADWSAVSGGAAPGTATFAVTAPAASALAVLGAANVDLPLPIRAFVSGGDDLDHPPGDYEDTVQFELSLFP